jgi:large subunit ribosomal protein L35
MPKMKTKRAARKRLEIKKSGKVSFGKAGARHNFGSKSPKRNRRMRGNGILQEVDAKKIRREMFPYGSP